MTPPHPGRTTADVRMEPFDQHNRRLIANVRPADWTNPEPANRYHLVVIGAGTAGLVTAIVATGLGARVALVERHLMGGDCLNVGCVPSKGVISAARAWDARRRAPFGAPETTAAGDFGAAMERMRKLRADISQVDGARRFRDAGVDVFLGHGRFVSGDTVDVDGARLRFKRAVIATGGRATAPPIPGLDAVPYLTNETVFSLTELPPRLVVIGAGPIGCELAQAFARLGSTVTLLDVAPQVLIREDPDAALVIQQALADDGVRLELGAAITAVEKTGDGSATGATVVFERAGQSERVSGDRLLMAVGRKPNVDDLGLEVAGVEAGPAGITVDDRLRTTNPRVFAAGDVTPHYKFTHLADAHAGIVIQNALFFGRARASRLVVPWCTYTTPEIAHVGLYERDARAQGIAVDKVTVPLAEVDRAKLDGETEGFLKLVLAAGSDRILGATLVAEHAGEMIGALTLAINQRIGLGKFASTIFPYPTQAEVIKKAANLWRKGKLSPRVQAILRAWFRLTD